VPCQPASPCVRGTANLTARAPAAVLSALESGCKADSAPALDLPPLPRLRPRQRPEPDRVDRPPPCAGGRLLPRREVLARLRPAGHGRGGRQHRLPRAHGPPVPAPGRRSGHTAHEPARGGAPGGPAAPVADAPAVDDVDVAAERTRVQAAAAAAASGGSASGGAAAASAAVQVQGLRKVFRTLEGVPRWPCATSGWAWTSGTSLGSWASTARVRSTMRGRRGGAP